MKMEKTAPETAAAFDAAMPDDPRVERRKMFGHPAAFVNGNMFAGAYGTGINVRLEPDSLRELLETPGAAPFEVMGRTMKGRAVVPSALHADPAALRAWLTRSLEETAKLPAKTKD